MLPFYAEYPIFQLVKDSGFKRIPNLQAIPLS